MHFTPVADLAFGLILRTRTFLRARTFLRSEILFSFLELRVDLIHTMTNKYRSNQLDFVNRNSDFLGYNKKDAHSIWFDLITLKKFMYHIEKTSRDLGAGINRTISDKDLGIRIYYAAYPKKEENWKVQFPDLIDLYSDPNKQLYEHLHTLVMVPTLNIEGKMVDFNPKDTATYPNGLYDMPGYVVTPSISSSDNVQNEKEEETDDQNKFLKIVKDITSKGFVRNNYKKKLVDLSDIRISLKGKKTEGAYPPWKGKKN